MSGKFPSHLAGNLDPAKFCKINKNTYSIFNRPT